ncbi:MAG: hypothetical protein DRQ55_06945 [Planctomycetota bacterium]|nr:MAG: hypothetical protein DRQ55_06850 [Planctomycetota bacterium]RKY20684.1 MAG: hypothetical protein DRQ55_06945 [Planctomycetota bacterium]
MPSATRTTWIWGLALLGVPALATLLSVVAGRSQQLPLDAPFSPAGSLSYTVALPPLEARWAQVAADGAGSPQASSLVLLEDGSPLGPAHALHASISESGGGAFSHWGGTLYFSTSDATDPNTNGRRYTLEFSGEPEAWVGRATTGLALLSALVWLIALLSITRVRATAVRALAVTGMLLLLLNLAGALLEPDLPARFPSREFDTTINFDAAWERIESSRGAYRSGQIDAAQHVANVMWAVNRRMTNIHSRYVRRDDALRPRLLDNWVLWACDWDERHRSYEWQAPARALQRGLGMCGAQSITTARLLEQDGFEAGLWESEAHAVAWARPPAGPTQVIDSDYGVVIEAEPAGLREALERVNVAYRELLEPSVGDITAVVERHYGTTYARVTAIADIGSVRYDASRFLGLEPLTFEDTAFLLKWLIPIAWLLPWALSRALRRARAAGGHRTTDVIDVSRTPGDTGSAAG